MGRHWALLEQLQAHNSPISVSDLSKLSGTHISNLSKALDELHDEIEPRIIQFEQQPRPEGGRPFKLTSLTPEGRTLVGTIIGITAGRPELALKEPNSDEIDFLVKEIKSPRSEEAYEAAWNEMNSLLRSSQLWNVEAVWNLIRDSIHFGSRDKKTSQALSVIQALLFQAQSHLGPNNVVSRRVKREYQKSFEETLGKTENEWASYKQQIMAIMDYFLKENEKFELCWTIWQNHLNDIKDEGLYSQFLQPFLDWLRPKGVSDKKAVTARLYELMNNADPLIRRRALSMHQRMVS